jgi:hypothetical protein
MNATVLLAAFAAGIASASAGGPQPDLVPVTATTLVAGLPDLMRRRSVS